MKFLLVLPLVFIFSLSNGQDSTDRKLISQIVISFITSWNNHDFSDMATYATADLEWVNHFGTSLKGRDEVQKWNQTPHNTFLKTAHTTLESMTIRFITQDVAIVTVIHQTSAFYPPDGIDRGNNKQEGAREIKSMVVVKQNNKWLLCHNQTTMIEDSTIQK